MLNYWGLNDPFRCMPLLNDPFCCIHCSSDSQCFSMCQTTRKNRPFLWRDLYPHLIHGSYGPRKSAPQSSQTVSQSIQSFLQDSWKWQTDRPSYSVCSNRSHLAIAAMQPNNNCNLTSHHTFGKCRPIFTDGFPRKMPIYLW